MMLKSLAQSVIGLGLFAILTAGVIAYTQINTADRIVANEAAAKATALYELLPPETHDNDMLADTLEVQDTNLLPDGSAGEAYVARKEGKAVAVILPVVAPDGYTGSISSIVGINADGTLAGVRVIAHKETPGLGDKVELQKSDWILQFEGKSLSNPNRKGWTVKKDRGEFDQLTGATITPRAIVKSVYRALVYFNANQDVLLADAVEPQDSDSEASTDTNPATADI